MPRLDRARDLLARARTLLKTRSFGDSAFLVGGALGAQLMFFLAAPFVTRLYRPADLGVMATTMSVVLLARQVATMNYHQAIPVVRQEIVARRLGALTLMLSLGVVLIVGLVLAAGAALPLGGEVGRWFDSVWWVAPLMLAALCVNDVLSYSVTRSGPMRALGQARIGQGAAYAGGQIVGGLLHPAGSVLCLAYAAGFVASDAWLAFRRSGQAAVAFCRPARLWVLARKFVRYPRYIMPSNLLAQGGVEIPSLVIVSFYGLHEGGLFFLTVRVIGLFNQMLGETATWITYARMAELARTDPAGLRRFTFRFAGWGMLLGGPAVLIMAAVVAWICPYVLGPEYREVRWIVMVVAVSLPFQIFLLPFAALNIVGAEALQARTLVLRLALISVCVLVPAILRLPFLWLVAGFALGTTLAFMLVFYVWVRALPDANPAPAPAN